MNTIKDTKKRCKQSIDHLNRIQGQIETLKSYIKENRHCGEIAQLTTSIAKSFDSLRFKTLEGFVLNELLSGKKARKEKIEELQRIINLYKK